MRPYQLGSRIFLVLLGVVYLMAAPLFGLFDTLERNEATVAGGFAQNGQSWCLSRSLGLFCTTRFELKIARRIFTHTDFFNARAPESLSVLAENGEPIRVRYNRKACRGALCTVLEADHKGRTLIPFTPIGMQESALIWLLMIGGGLCFWSAFRKPR